MTRLLLTYAQVTLFRKLYARRGKKYGLGWIEYLAFYNWARYTTWYWRQADAHRYA